MFTSSVDDDYWNFGTLPVIERIGALSYLFAHSNSCLIDFYEGGNLRCYYDNEIGYVQIDSTTTCDFVLSSNEITAFTSIEISPNPFSTELKIKLPENFSNSIITIYSLNGSVIYQTTSGNSTVVIPANSIIPGVYFLHVLDNHIQYHLQNDKIVIYWNADSPRKASFVALRRTKRKVEFIFKFSFIGNDAFFFPKVLTILGLAKVGFKNY
ncbi:MAG: T9SS type A sorting domain-containing protein [Bacteroidetes bacterium]|nr:T9SS type A sorting domain-containing protein [Bacteroidota bacterium]